MAEEHIGDMEEQFLERLAVWARENIGEFCAPLSALGNQTESPIEQKMLMELAFANWGVVSNSPLGALVPMVWHDVTMPFAPDEALPLIIAPQYPIGRYRIDVAIFAGKGPLDGPQRVRICVECDGHDYHERTKGQASRDKKRDRELQRAGWYVFRFTGSDIHKDARACAQEVANFTELAFVQRCWSRESIRSLKDMLARDDGDPK